jgi:hypothetical protein
VAPGRPLRGFRASPPGRARRDDVAVRVQARHAVRIDVLRPLHVALDDQHACRVADRRDDLAVRQRDLHGVEADRHALRIGGGHRQDEARQVLADLHEPVEVGDPRVDPGVRDEMEALDVLHDLRTPVLSEADDVVVLLGGLDQGDAGEPVLVLHPLVQADRLKPVSDLCRLGPVVDPPISGSTVFNGDLCCFHDVPLRDALNRATGLPAAYRNRRDAPRRAPGNQHQPRSPDERARQT